MSLLKSRVFSVNNDALYDFLISLKAAILPSALIFILFFRLSVHNSIIAAATKPNDYEMYFIKSGPPGYLTAPLLISGLIMALVLFRFLSVTARTNVLLSAGLSRWQLFRNRCAAAVAGMFLSVFIPLTITLFINFNGFGVKGIMLSSYVFLTVSLFAVLLIGFCAGVLCAVLAGTAREGFFGGVSLLVLPALSIVFIAICLSVFLKGYPNSLRLGDFALNSFFSVVESSQFFYKMFYLNPILLNINPQLPYHDSFFDNDIWTEMGIKNTEAYYFKNPTTSYVQEGFPTASFIVFLCWIVFCVILLFAAYRLFVKRNAEIGGFYRSSKSVAAIISAFFVLSAAHIGLLAGLLRVENPFDLYHAVNFFDMSVSEKLVLAAFTFILTFAAALVCIIFHSWKNKKLKKTLRLLFLTPAVFLIPVVCLLGGFGYSKRVPDIAEIEVINISVPYYFSASEFESNLSAHDPYFARSVSGFESEAEKETVAQIHRALSADYSGESFAKIIYINYRLKDKRVIQRRYSTVSDENLLKLAGLFGSDTVQDEIALFLCDRNSWITLEQLSEPGDIYFYNHTIFDKPLAIEPAWRRLENAKISLREPDSFSMLDITPSLDEGSYDALMECIANDYNDMSASQFYTPESPPLCVLSVYSTDTEYAYTSTYYHEFYIYGSMQRTMQFLCSREKNLLDSLAKNAKAPEYEITKISLYKCSEKYFFRQYAQPLPVSGVTAESFIAENKSVEIFMPDAVYTDKSGTVSPYAVYTKKDDIAMFKGRLFPGYLTLGQDVSYAAVEFSGGKEAVYIVKN